MSYPIAHIDPEDPKQPEDPMDDFPEDHEYMPDQNEIEEEDELNRNIQALKFWEKMRQNSLENVTLQMAEYFPNWIKSHLEGQDEMINYYTKKICSI